MTVIFEAQPFDELLNSIKNKADVVFLLEKEHTSLSYKDVINEIEIKGEIEMPPTLYFEKNELRKALLSCNTDTQKGKWNYTILLTYLNDGRILYSNDNPKNEKYFFIKIIFPK